MVHKIARPPAIGISGKFCLFDIDAAYFKLHKSMILLIDVFQPILESEMNGGQFYYLVTYQRLDIDHAVKHTRKIHGVTENELVVKDQATFIPYAVQVQAANVVGLSTVRPEIIIAYSGQGRKF